MIFHLFLSVEERLKWKNVCVNVNLTIRNKSVKILNIKLNVIQILINNKQISFEDTKEIINSLRKGNNISLIPSTPKL